MDSKRRAELLKRLSEELGDKVDEEQRVLDLLEWSLADIVPHTRESIAEFRAKILLDKPYLWPWHIEACQADRRAWETLSGLVRLYRQRARARSELVFLPPPLADWVLDVVCGYLKRPKWKGRPKRNEYRDLHIAISVARLNELGRPYAPPSKGSACHLIADRLSMGVGTVRDIWFKNRKQVRALEASLGGDFLSLYEVPRPDPN